MGYENANTTRRFRRRLTKGEASLFSLEHRIEGRTLYLRASGFVPSEQAQDLKNKVLELLRGMDGQPFKVLFDLRGLKAISPRAQKELGEIDEFLYDSCVSKVGTVFDSIIAQVQHLRTAHNGKAKAMFDTGRSMIFTDPAKCRAWIEGAGAENAAGHG